MQVLNSLKGAMVVFASTTALTLALGSQAFAVDADAVAARLQAMYAKQGGELTFDAVKADGSSIILQGTKAKFSQVSDKPFAIGDINLNNVQDTTGGGFSIGEVIVPDLTIPAKDDKNNQIVIKGMKMDNVLVPSKDASSPLEQMLFYDKSTVGEIQLGKPGVDGAVLKDLVVSLNSTDRAKKISFSFDVGSIEAKFSDAAKNPLSVLKTNSLSATIASKGTWAPNDGDATIDSFVVDAKDIGKLNLTANIGGYDLAFVDAVKKTQENMAKADADKNAAGMAMLGLAEQLTVKDLSIRFDDASLTEKLLEHYAKQQKTDAKTLSQQAKMLVPLLAMQFNNPDFAKAVKEAAEKFFDNPQSLEITATPAQPVSLASIVATASLDPTKLIQLLKVGIVANK